MGVRNNRAFGLAQALRENKPLPIPSSSFIRVTKVLGLKPLALMFYAFTGLSRTTKAF